MPTFQHREKYATVVLWDAEPDMFFITYDDDFDEYRPLELDLRNSRASEESESFIAEQLASLTESHHLNLDSYSIVAKIRHTEYTPTSSAPGVIDTELIIVAAVSVKSVKPNLDALTPVEFARQVNHSSVLCSQSKHAIIKNCA